MDKRTVFSVVFFIVMLIIAFAIVHNSPVPYGSKYHLAQPRDVDVGGLNFTVSWGFLEDDNETEISQSEISNHKVIKYEKTFHQNNLLLLSISVFESDDRIDLDDINDGSWQQKSINGVDGLFKTEPVNYGTWNKTFDRYCFSYMKEGRIIMLECDKMNIIAEIIE